MIDELKWAASDRYPLLKDWARQNRKNPTRAEAVLWERLRGQTLRTKFFRQYIIADYIVDFVSLKSQLIIEVDGALYQLPCPVSEFVNNGWEVVDGKSEESIEGRGSGKVTLRKNNFEFWTYVRNYDDNATAVENSFVTDFQLRDHDANVSVKIAGGVEYHMDQDEAMKILEPMGYEFEEGTIEGSGYLTLKYESFKKYEIYVNDGIIKDIAVVNQLKRDELYK